MYYYCENCKKFLTLEEVYYEEIIRGGEEWAKCKYCNPTIETTVACIWLRTGKSHWKDFVEGICPNIDELNNLCSNCDSRFWCWTNY